MLLTCPWHRFWNQLSFYIFCTLLFYFFSWRNCYKFSNKFLFKNRKCIVISIGILIFCFSSWSILPPSSTRQTKFLEGFLDCRLHYYFFMGVGAVCYYSIFTQIWLSLSFIFSSKREFHFYLFFLFFSCIFGFYKVGKDSIKFCGPAAVSQNKYFEMSLAPPTFS